MSRKMFPIVKFLTNAALSGTDNSFEMSLSCALASGRSSKILLPDLRELEIGRARSDPRVTANPSPIDQARAMKERVDQR